MQGANTAGCLGDSTTTARLVPTQVSGGGLWIDVSVGRSYSCAINATYILYCWGSNGSGQLGTGAASNVPLSVTAGAGTWRAIAAGYDHTCGIGYDTSLWCWVGAPPARIE